MIRVPGASEIARCVCLQTLLAPGNTSYRLSGRRCRTPQGDCIRNFWGIHLTGVERRLEQCSAQAAKRTRTSAKLGAAFSWPPLEENPWLRLNGHPRGRLSGFRMRPSALVFCRFHFSSVVFRSILKCGANATLSLSTTRWCNRPTMSLNKRKQYVAVCRIGRMS